MSDLSCKLKMGAASRFLSVFAVTLDGQNFFFTIVYFHQFLTVTTVVNVNQI